MRILITGFGAFPGAPVNPTAPLVTRLARVGRRRGLRCVAHVFETSYAAVDRELPALIATHRPDAILMFGLASRRRHVCIERFAHNRMSVRTRDAGGALPDRPVIAADAARRLTSTAPLTRMLAAARATGTATALSRDAGDYLCNYLYWGALAAIDKPGGPRVAVFVHVPLRAPSTRRNTGAKRRDAAADRLFRTGLAVLSVLSRR